MILAGRSDRLPIVATSARAWPSDRSASVSAPGVQWNGFIAPMVWPRSHSGMACTEANAPERATAATNRGQLLGLRQVGDLGDGAVALHAGPASALELPQFPGRGVFVGRSDLT